MYDHMDRKDGWDVFEERSEEGRLIALHVVPVIILDADEGTRYAELSALHTLSATCPCQPLRSGVNQATSCPILSHNDPEQLGMSEAEWAALASASSTGLLPN